MVRILAVFLILISTAPAFGAGFAKVGAFGFTYDGLFTGTRSTALGQGDMAGAYGPGATQINTAPLPLGDGIEASYNGNPFLADLDFAVWGADVEVQGLRLGFSQFRLFMDPQLVRTAYNPEGTGETFDAGDDISILSLGYDLGRLVDEDGRWQWTLGAAWRHYASFLAESKVEEDTWDVGTSLGWTTPHPHGRARLALAVSWQNVFEKEYTYDERMAYLPASVRTGITLEATFGQAAWGGEAAKVLMAYSHRFLPDTWRGRDTDHFGVEFVGAGYLAMRMGHNSQLPGNINSWGLGLILARDFMGPFTVSADYGTYETVLRELEMWSVRARYAF